MANRTKLTPKKIEQFLEELRRGTSVSGAARLIGVARQTIYDHRETDPAFRSAFEAALDEGTDRLEDEARRRAVDGTAKPVFQQGNFVGFVREYSDTLLIFLLKARRPDKYRERHEITVNWRAELAAAGIPESEVSNLFDEMVNELAKHLNES